jgi:hypothetical protein
MEIENKEDELIKKIIKIFKRISSNPSSDMISFEIKHKNLKQKELGLIDYELKESQLNQLETFEEFIKKMSEMLMQ